jgi:hypothetical protein
VEESIKEKIEVVFPKPILKMKKIASSPLKLNKKPKKMSFK